MLVGSLQVVFTQQMWVGFTHQVTIYPTILMVGFLPTLRLITGD